MEWGGSVTSDDDDNNIDDESSEPKPTGLTNYGFRLKGPWALGFYRDIRRGSRPNWCNTYA